MSILAAKGGRRIRTKYWSASVSDVYIMLASKCYLVVAYWSYMT